MDVVPVAAADAVDVMTPGAAAPVAIPAASGEVSPDRAIAAAPEGAPENRADADPATKDLPEAGTGVDLGSSLGISQLLAMVMAAACAFASWRSRVA